MENPSELTPEEKLERLYWSLQHDFEELMEANPLMAIKFSDWIQERFGSWKWMEPLVAWVEKLKNESL